MIRVNGYGLTLRVFQILGIAALSTLSAAYVTARQRRRAEERRRLDERLEKDRWESEGGASRTGPATPSAISAP